MAVVRLDLLQASEARVSARFAKQLTRDVRFMDRRANRPSPSQLQSRREQLARMLPNQARADILLEKILDGNDLTPVAFLHMGVKASRAVGRMQSTLPDFRRQFGTGFLVGPNVLMTNHHVLPDVQTARQTRLDLDYELDLNGQELFPQQHRLAPDQLFETNEQLDCTVVAVNPQPEFGTHSLAHFGWLPLSNREGKAIVGEFLSIIQHPGGERKQVCVRENKLLRYGDDTLWYQADTVAGSSGSPVFNPFWQVVALHHSGVPERDAKGRVLLRDKTAVPEGELGRHDESQIVWIANEGIRISRIWRWLDSLPKTNPLLAGILTGDAPPAKIERTAGMTSVESHDSARKPQSPLTIGAAEGNRMVSEAWGKGYNAHHLGNGPLYLPLPEGISTLPDDLGELGALGTQGWWEVPCDGFSLGYHAGIRQTMLAAGHLSGDPTPGESPVAWRIDRRLPGEWQTVTVKGEWEPPSEECLLLRPQETLAEHRLGIDADVWLTLNRLPDSNRDSRDGERWVQLANQVVERLRADLSPVTVWAGLWPRAARQKTSRDSVSGHSARGCWKVFAWPESGRLHTVCLIWNWSPRQAPQSGVIQQISLSHWRELTGWQLGGGWRQAGADDRGPSRPLDVTTIRDVAWPQRPGPRSLPTAMDQ